MNTKTFLSLAVCLLATACAKPCRIVWTEGPTDPESGKTIHTMTIQNPPAGTDWTLWFSQFRTPCTASPPRRTPAGKKWSSATRPAPW